MKVDGMNLLREKRKIERLIREGLNQFCSNDYESAWRAFERALFLDEQHPVANTLGAASLLNLRRIDDAEPLARRGIRQTPHLSLAHYYLALLLIAQENIQEAESEIWEAIAIEPYNAGYPLLLGRLLLTQSREVEACEQLQHCVQLSPENAEAHFVFGVCLMRCGQIWKAKDEFDITIRLQPENDDALAFDALLCMAKADDLLTTPPKLGGYRYAANLLRHAVELNPTNELAGEWLRLAEETIERISSPSEAPLPPEKWYKTLSKHLLLFVGFASACIAINGVLLWLGPSHHRTEDFLVGSLFVSVIYLFAFLIMTHLRKNFSALPPTIASFAEQVSKAEATSVEGHSRSPGS